MEKLRIRKSFQREMAEKVSANHQKLQPSRANTPSEQSSPNSEKTPKKPSEVMKRLSGSQSNAECMAKASRANSLSAKC
jgi:hypothetical protein